MKDLNSEDEESNCLRIKPTTPTLMAGGIGPALRTESTYLGRGFESGDLVSAVDVV